MAPWTSKRRSFASSHLRWRSWVRQSLRSSKRGGIVPALKRDDAVLAGTQFLHGIANMEFDCLLRDA